MEKNIRKIISENLKKEMNLAVYGHYGFGILMFPTYNDSCLENEENGLYQIIKPSIEKGKCRIFSIDGIFSESWLSNDIDSEQKSRRHLEYNNFIVEEAVPFIYNECGGPVPIMTAGCSTGGFIAANTYFRRPDIFYGTIAMSATFNIEHYAKGYFDDNCYYNSPVHYLPHLTTDYWLTFLESRHHVYLLSGSGAGENPENTINLHNILDSKNIDHFQDIWGHDWGHNWNTWREMLGRIVNDIL